MVITMTSLEVFNQAKITTGNNPINPADPYAADVVIGSDALGGIRHDASIMWWTPNSAIRIFSTDNTFKLST
jgi:hypothetical protein